MKADDDEAWRSIVDHYGERAELDQDPPAEVDPPPAASSPAPAARPSWEDPYPDADWTEDRFVPPEAPPLPRAPQDRLLAWVALFGAPALLILVRLAEIDIPQILLLILVAAFVGGFVYLVATMSSGPRDPDDDGARL